MSSDNEGYTPFDFLKHSEPWDNEKPAFEPCMSGWLAETTWAMLDKHLPHDDSIIVECGTWVGKSAVAMLQSRPDIRLICIDTFAGSPEHHRMPRWKDRLDELYALIRDFAASKPASDRLGIMARLRDVRIEAPSDFATNLDLYLSGEKSVPEDIH